MRMTVAGLLALVLLAGADPNFTLASGDLPAATRGAPVVTQTVPLQTQAAPPPTAAQSEPQAPAPAARDAPEAALPGTIPAGFVSETAAVNGASLHYVAGGRGRGLVLLHGFPEDWSVYAEIMPQLAAEFRVVAVDLRGIGGSAPPPSGYDAAAMAEDIHQLAQRLKLEQPYVVGHGLGGGVAYALARLHPDAVRGIMILDAAIAGIDPWDKIIADPRLWNIRFHQVPGLAEQLLAGQEALYFEHVLRSAADNPRAISDADIVRYAQAYSGPGQLAAAMRMFRAFDANARFGRQKQGPLDVEITLVGGAAPGKGLKPQLNAIAEGLARAGASVPRTHQIGGSGHYVVDERPDEVAGLIDRQASKSNREPLRADYNVISF
jgi:pimeloyl-ACP methyl ester carboxylesterase